MRTSLPYECAYNCRSTASILCVLYRAMRIAFWSCYSEHILGKRCMYRVLPGWKQRPRHSSMLVGTTSRCRNVFDWNLLLWLVYVKNSVVNGGIEVARRNLVENLAFLQHREHGR